MRLNADPREMALGSRRRSLRSEPAKGAGSPVEMINGEAGVERIRDFEEIVRKLGI
jgi:hypothetical protein